MECVLEAVRVLGNLTQSKYVRELVVKNEGIQNCLIKFTLTEQWKT